MSIEFGRKNRLDPQVSAPAVLTSTLKRSSNISLIVMSTLAFTATFAGGSAYLAWQKPNQPQNCAPAADGTQTCATPRRSAAYWPAIHYWWSPERSAPPAGRPTSGAGAAAVGKSASTAAFVPTSGERGAMEGRAVRGGFGESARTVFRGSAAS